MSKYLLIIFSLISCTCGTKQDPIGDSLSYCYRTYGILSCAPHELNYRTLVVLETTVNKVEQALPNYYTLPYPFPRVLAQNGVRLQFIPSENWNSSCQEHFGEKCDKLNGMAIGQSKDLAIRYQTDANNTEQWYCVLAHELLHAFEGLVLGINENQHKTRYLFKEEYHTASIEHQACSALETQWGTASSKTKQLSLDGHPN